MNDNQRQFEAVVSTDAPKTAALDDVGAPALTTGRRLL
jgi:hypothetical protein